MLVLCSGQQAESSEVERKSSVYCKGRYLLLCRLMFYGVLIVGSESLRDSHLVLVCNTA